MSFHNVYNVTVTDNHIKMGCEQRTFEEWEQFLKSDEVIETNRDTDKFKAIENTLRVALTMKHLKKY